MGGRWYYKCWPATTPLVTSGRGFFKHPLGAQQINDELGPFLIQQIEFHQKPAPRLPEQKFGVLIDWGFHCQKAWQSFVNFVFWRPQDLGRRDLGWDETKFQVALFKVSGQVGLSRHSR